MGKSILHDIKEKCRSLEHHCHNHINRALTCMKDNPDSCKLVGDYLNLCMVNEKLCSYVCCLCCNIEKINKPCKDECKQKCDKMIECCEKINKSKMENVNLKHLGIPEMIKKCKVLKSVLK